MGQGDLLELCVAILCLGEAKLSSGLQILMASIAQPQAIVQGNRCLEGLEAERKQNESKDMTLQAKREITEARAFVKEEKVKHREVLKTWIQQAQGLLIWLVDRQRGTFGAEPSLFATRSISSSSPWATMLHDKCVAST
jgi:hypothetical protein